uniref:Uncharacterized protein n=1 Tax=Anopheles merus TaxID=30066 RepID=A0A182UM28_ANOME
MNGIGFADTIAHSLARRFTTAGRSTGRPKPVATCVRLNAALRAPDVPCEWNRGGGCAVVHASQPPRGKNYAFATTTYAKRCRQCVTRARTAFGSNSYWAYGGPSGWNRPCSDDGSDAESFGEARDDAVRSVPPLPACFGWARLRLRANRSSDAISEQSDTCMGEKGCEAVNGLI